MPPPLQKGVTDDTNPLPGAPVRDRLMEMGDSVLKSVTSTLIRRRKLSFIASRLPPFDPDLHPQGPPPTVDSKVQLKWPDHMVVLREWEVREMEGCGLLPPRLRQGRGGRGRGERSCGVSLCGQRQILSHGRGRGRAKAMWSQVTRSQRNDGNGPRSPHCLPLLLDPGRHSPRTPLGRHPPNPPPSLGRGTPPGHMTSHMTFLCCHTTSPSAPRGTILVHMSTYTDILVHKDSKSN
ncbi:hypothetical protein GBAR_LOCUS9158, partial [Geodia barretti]